MALSRFVSLSSPFFLHHRVHPPSTIPVGLPTPSLVSFPNCPLRFTIGLPPFLPKKRFVSRVQSSSSSAMEAPPEGYRRNVGICLINDSKKVLYKSLSGCLSSMLFVIYIYTYYEIHIHTHVYIHIHTEVESEIFFLFADFCCVKVRCTRFMANAAGNCRN